MKINPAIILQAWRVGYSFRDPAILERYYPDLVQAGMPKAKPLFQPVAPELVLGLAPALGTNASYCDRGKCSATQEDTMNLKQLFVAVPTTLLILGSGVANAGQTINDVGAIACVSDKWDVKEPEKGHKLIDFAGRCIRIPDDPAALEAHGGLRRKIRVHA